MNENNFCKRVSYLTPGDGFRKQAPIDLLSQVKTTAGLILTASTVPAILATETSFLAMTCVANQTHVGAFNWNVPPDYDGSADELRILIAANFNGDTAADLALGKITPTIYRKRPVPSIIPDGKTAFPAGLALTADLGAPATAAGVIPSLGANLATKWIEINADFWTDATKLKANRSLAATANATIQAGDLLTIVLTSAAHTTDDIDVYGIEIWYRSNLAFTDINSR